MPHDRITQSTRQQGVGGEGKQGQANDGPFLADQPGHRRSRHHVVHADHVAGGPAYRLQGHHPDRIGPDSLPHSKLEQGEHHVADGVAAGHESPQATDERGEDRPGGLGQGGHAGSQHDRHLVVAGSASIRVDEYLHHGDGEDEGYRGGRGGPGRLDPDLAESGEAQAVSPAGQHGDHQENGSGQVEGLYSGRDCGVQDVGEGEGPGPGPFQERKESQAREHQQQAHQQIGGPGSQQSHGAGRWLLLESQRSGPVDRPVFGSIEIPTVFGSRHENALFGGKDHQNQAHKAAE